MRGWRHRLVASALAIGTVVAGCGGSYLLPTDPAWHADGPCRGIGLDATLRSSASEPRLFWLVDRTTGQRAELVWPSGYSARDDFGLEIWDDHDAFVGKEGDAVTGACGRTGTDGPFRVSSDGVVRAT